MPHKRLPPDLPPSTADLTTPEGVDLERRDLEALHGAGRIDGRALRVGLECLDLLDRGLARAEAAARRSAR